MKDGYWVIRTYESGLVGEKIKFWVPGERPKKKLTRKQRSDVRKAAQNEESAVRQMARLINANFHPGDYLLGLDYSPEGMLRVEYEAAGQKGGRAMLAPTVADTRTVAHRCASLRGDGDAGEKGSRIKDQGSGGRGTRADERCSPLRAQNDGRRSRSRGAHCAPLPKTFLTQGQRMDAIRKAAGHQLVNCIRRVKRELAAEGVELKYIFVTSDTDGKTGEAVRVHHHLIVNREARDAFVRKWQEKGLGGVSWSPLEKQEDYIEIAKYLLAQVRKVESENQYTSSRNLIRPQPKDRVAASSSEVRVPKGAHLLHRQEYKPGKAQYIRYRIDRDSA